MSGQKTMTVLSAVALLTLLSGCMPKMTIEQMKEMRPQRPAELDMLNAFIGTWESTGESRMGGLEEVFATSGTQEITWGGDGWFLIERTKFTMGELGEMEGHGTWVYDAKGKKFRTFWADTMGGFGTGTVRYNKKSDTWYLTASMNTPFGKSTGKGTIKFTDPDTMEWCWDEYAMGGLVHTMALTGTSKRK